MRPILSLLVLVRLVLSEWVINRESIAAGESILLGRQASFPQSYVARAAFHAGLAYLCSSLDHPRSNPETLAVGKDCEGQIYRAILLFAPLTSAGGVSVVSSAFLHLSVLRTDTTQVALQASWRPARQQHIHVPARPMALCSPGVRCGGPLPALGDLEDPAGLLRQAAAFSHP